MAKNNHADCRNFTPIDVAKGICHANNDSIILIDSETCPMFTPIAKCKCCKCFIEADENNIGICDGFKIKDWTYGRSVHPPLFNMELKFVITINS